MLDRSKLSLGLTTALAGLAFLPVTGHAGDGPYVSFLAGGVDFETVEADDIDVDYDTGFAFAGQFGYKFDVFRLGGEISYHLTEGVSDNDVNADIDIARFTLNGYIDLPITPQIGPYIGGGFGVASVSNGDDFNDDFEEEDTAFTFHGEAGLNVSLTDQFVIAPVYRYLWIDTDIGGQTEPLEGHLFGVSLRYQFFPGYGRSRYAERERRRGYDRYRSSYEGDIRHDSFDRR